MNGAPSLHGIPVVFVASRIARAGELIISRDSFVDYSGAAPRLRYATPPRITVAFNPDSFTEAEACGAFVDVLNKPRAPNERHTP